MPRRALHLAYGVLVRSCAGRTSRRCPAGTGFRGAAAPDAALSRRRGQALVEFAAVLLPVLLLVVGIIQFGLLFGASVTLTNAAREAPRAGTIYVYDNSHTKAWNDAARCGDVVEAAQQALGFLSDRDAATSPSPCPVGACPTPAGRRPDQRRPDHQLLRPRDHAGWRLPGRHRSRHHLRA